MIIDGEKIKDKRIKSFLMIGQSNMAGRGEFNDVPKIDNPLCFMLRNGRWQKMSEPINPDRAVFEGEFHSGVSLGASFADYISKRYDCRVGLIPCADGGTDIDDWAKGGVLYDNALYSAKLAMRSSSFSGILWHQGESDCFDDNKAKAHKAKFYEMITSLINDIGVKSAPLIMGELSENYSERWGLKNRPNVINCGYREIATKLPLCALASAKGLVLKEDGIHFNSESLREFGVRYAKEYVKLIER